MHYQLQENNGKEGTKMKVVLRHMREEVGKQVRLSKRVAVETA